MAASKVIEINPNVHWYSLQELKFRFPIVNKRWQVNGDLFEYFYDLDEHIESDPWGRKLVSWKRPGQTQVNDWLNATTNGTYYRLTSVMRKTVALWMYPSPSHPLFK
jgi:hypothetical protein